MDQESAINVHTLYKKSKWMTYGILHSINKKDKLYKLLLKSDVNSNSHVDLKAWFKRYRKLYEVLLKRPNGYIIIGRFFCIKTIFERHDLS